MELYLYSPYMSPLNVLSGAKVKNEWSYTSTPPVCLHKTSYLVPRLRMSGAMPRLPLYVYTKRLIWCRGWERVELYLYLPHMCPLNVLSDAEVRNEWSCTSIFSVDFLGMDMDNFTVFVFAAVFTQKLFPHTFVQCCPHTCITFY